MGLQIVFCMMMVKGQKMNRHNKKPRIGVTLDYNTDTTYAQTPWYALRGNYVESFAKEGAHIVLLHYEYGDLNALIDELDGLVITGGNFDVDPILYGESIQHERVNPNLKRSAFEVRILKAAIAKKIPILGICGGHQLINVVMGGNLIQHIPQEIETCLEHEQKVAKHLPTHEVTIEPNTRLHGIAKKTTIKVNTTHHQAIKNLGKDLIVNARATDGVIEGIESTCPSWFCLGVQWHPEYTYTEHDASLIKHFVNICQTPQQK